MYAEHPENNPALDVEIPKELEFDAADGTQVWVALGYALSIPVLTFFTAFIVAAISRSAGGPLCDAGLASWICSRRFEILFPVISDAVAFAGVLGCAWICYLQWRKQGDWKPWLAVLWAVMPFSLLWFTATGTMAIIGH